MVYHVTVPGASYRGPQDGRVEQPIVAYIEGGFNSLGHQLAEEIRQQLRKLLRKTGEKDFDVT